VTTFLASPALPDEWGSVHDLHHGRTSNTSLRKRQRPGPRGRIPARGSAEGPALPRENCGWPAVRLPSHRDAAPGPSTVTFGSRPRLDVTHTAPRAAATVNGVSAQPRTPLRRANTASTEGAPDANVGRAAEKGGKRVACAVPPIRSPGHLHLPFLAETPENGLLEPD